MNGPSPRARERQAEFEPRSPAQFSVIFIKPFRCPLASFLREGNSGNPEACSEHWWQHPSGSYGRPVFTPLLGVLTTVKVYRSSLPSRSLSLSMDKGQMLENHKKIPGKHQEVEVTKKCGIHLEMGGALADMLPGDFQCIF